MIRVTPNLITAQLQRELGAALAAIAHQQELLSSGRRILVPADDPMGAAQAVTIRSRQAATKQFQDNVAAARSTLATTDTTLRAISEVVTQAIEAAVQGANDTNDTVARQRMAASAHQRIGPLVRLGKTRAGTGTFLFGGQESTTAPYTVARNSAGQITAVTPNARGIDAPTPAEVGEGVTVSTRVSGTG